MPVALTVRYLIDSLMLNKLTNIIHDTPRLSSLTVVRRGIPASTQFEVRVTIGG